MPASENSSIAKKKASSGLVRESPAKSLMLSTAWPLRFMVDDDAKLPSVHRHIDRDIDQDALRALVPFPRARPTSANSHMADRGIGHQPLDVGLPDRSERAQRHRGDRDKRPRSAATA